MFQKRGRKEVSSESLSLFLPQTKFYTVNLFPPSQNLSLVAQEVTCFNKHAPPLSHFRTKFKDRMALAVAVSSQPPSASPSTKFNWYVILFLSFFVTMQILD
ncbi:hypothetical protein V8G54_006825 [Vigna mungo]|uniref:Uncharacterized protein n=1 Tax=Vigna mungo TaxID=3915 RepID=A0AAQ3S7R0_VIGMU